MTNNLNGVVNLLLMFIVQLVMVLWSYFAVVVTDPGGVPANWLPIADEERGDVDPLVGPVNGGMDLGLNQSAMLVERGNDGVRFCHKCNRFKPPRCHHCSICEFLTWNFYFLCPSCFYRMKKA